MGYFLGSIVAETMGLIIEMKDASCSVVWEEGDFVWMRDNNEMVKVHRCSGVVVATTTIGYDGACLDR